MKQKISNVFYGWWIVAAGVVLCMFGYGGWFYSFGTLFNPISSDFGWARATTSIAFSFSRLEGGLEGLITGPLIDKFGPRFMVRVGFTMSAIGFFLLAKVDNFGMFIVSYSLLLSLGMNAGLYMPLQTTVARWFDKKRGLALGMLTTGAALGGSVLVPSTAWLITSYGWHTAVIVLAFVALILGWAMSFVLKSHGPEHYGYTADGIQQAVLENNKPEVKEKKSKPDSVSLAGLTLKEALKTKTFWLMAIAITCNQTAVSAIVVHEIPFIEDMGISKVIAAAALGTMTLMSAPGRLTSGWLADRIDPKYLYCISSIAQAIGLFIFSQATSMFWVWVFVSFFGLSYGFRIPLEPAMRAKYFGRKAFGSIMGYMNAFAVLGTFGGPYFAGWVFDTTGSYVNAFLVFAGMMIVAAVTIVLAKSQMNQGETALLSGQ